MGVVTLELADKVKLGWAQCVREHAQLSTVGIDLDNERVARKVMP